MWKIPSGFWVRVKNWSLAVFANFQKSLTAGECHPRKVSSPRFVSRDAKNVSLACFLLSLSPHIGWRHRPPFVFSFSSYPSFDCEKGTLLLASLDVRHEILMNLDTSSTQFGQQSLNGAKTQFCQISLYKPKAEITKGHNSQMGPRNGKQSYQAP